MSSRRTRAALVSFALAGLAPAGARTEPAASEWRSFQGTWSASGQRRSLAVEGSGTATIADVSGAVVLTSGEGLSRGFRGQAIGFDDGQGASVGRCVWTDARGDQVFSRLQGESLATGKRFRGTITGGTGRYAGLAGEYTFTWQYVVTGDDGSAIQGRAIGLEGQVHRTSDQ